jgi:hypothetical protein
MALESLLEIIPSDSTPLLHRLEVIPPHLLTVKIRQPSHEFTFGVGISFISYPLVLTPVV